MLYRRTGLPEEQELVLCTVTNVQGHAVFARIEEYGITGMIHISEVAPGRIRNIREFVKEGKVVVCKVLRINPERGHVDLSLRRVTEMQKRNKIDAIKNEQRAEKIVEQLAHQLKKPVEGVYKEVAAKILPTYAYLHQCFEEIVAGEASLEELGISAAMAKPLAELIAQRIKPTEVSVAGTLTITTYAADGIDTIRETLLSIVGHPQTSVTYLGGGKYKVTVIAPEYKAAEELLTRVTEEATAYVTQRKGAASFARDGQ